MQHAMNQKHTDEIMTDKEKQAFIEAERQIKNCDLSFAYVQGMQHCLDIFRHYLVYKEKEQKQCPNNGKN